MSYVRNLKKYSAYLILTLSQGNKTQFYLLLKNPSPKDNIEHFVTRKKKEPTHTSKQENIKAVRNENIYMKLTHIKLELKRNGDRFYAGIVDDIPKRNC
jgi:hypothetical protein